MELEKRVEVLNTRFQVRRRGVDGVWSGCGLGVERQARERAGLGMGAESLGTSVNTRFQARAQGFIFRVEGAWKRGKGGGGGGRSLNLEF